MENQKLSVSRSLIDTDFCRKLTDLKLPIETSFHNNLKNYIKNMAD